MEDELRYKYVKYTRLYSDVLHALLIERGLKKRRRDFCQSIFFLEYWRGDKDPDQSYGHWSVVYERSTVQFFSRVCRTVLAHPSAKVMWIG